MTPASTTPLADAESERAFHKGVRAAITWLHKYARGMTDPHARALLNTAAFALGTEKPDPNTILSSALPGAEGEPIGYRYLYPHYSGGTAWHYGTNGREINGSRPIRSEPIYAAPPTPRPCAEDDAANFLAFCVRHFTPSRRHTISDAELLSIVEYHPALRDRTNPKPTGEG